MIKFLSSFVLLLSAPVLCAAADWQLTTEANSGDTFYMDFSSIAPVGTYRKAWVQINHQNQLETDGYPKKKYQTTRLLYYFDCQAKTLSTFQTVRYGEKFAGGEVVESKSFKFNSKDLEDVVPDTVGEAVMQTACTSNAERTKIKAKNAAEVAEIIKKLKALEAVDSPAARRAVKADTESTTEL